MTLRVLVRNAGDLLSKLGEFQHSLHSHKPDIAIVTETKFTAQKCQQHQVTFPGYFEPVRRDRTEHGGGVAVWIRTGPAFREVQIAEGSSHEVIWLSVRLADGRSVVVCALYRSGSLSGNDTGMLEYIDRVLDHARTLGSHVLLAGDFNVHNVAWLMSNKTTKADEHAEDIHVISTAWSSMSTSLPVVPTQWTSSCLTFLATLLSLATHHWVPQTTSACLL